MISGKEIIENYDSAIKIFLNENSNLEGSSLQTQIDLVSILYKELLQITLREPRLRDKCNKNHQLLENVKLSVETYMLHRINKPLFESIQACTAHDDSKFNKLIRNLSDLQLKDLNVPSHLYDTISYAKRELAKMSGYSTILGKVGCLRKAIEYLSRSNDENFVTSDELLPIIVFLIIKTGLSNWIAQLTFMLKFRFSVTLASDETNYLITTLEAAIEHIRSEVLFGSSEPECQIEEIIPKPILKPNENLTLIDFFEGVRVGDYNLVESMLNLTESKDKNFTKLCHPLCSCDKCENILSKNMCNTSPTVYSCDDRGFTALHVACFHGRPKLVDLLILNRAKVNATDYSGATPLHYAALRGHQNALLLLLHAGSNINARDNDKNTPLHFASNNGHEGCVKAMLYYSEHSPKNFNINCLNNLGDTPLHYASRWGYVDIVDILLEYGARANIENKRKLTALDCAHSIHITRLICDRKVNLIDQKPIEPNLDFVEEIVDNSGIKAQSMEEIKKVESLLHAVAFGDINLTCYYLNISSSNDFASKKPCHPLCNCVKCTPTTSSPKSTRKDILHINICNSDGLTPLHVAAMHGWYDLTKLLLENGARVDLITKSKQLTPLHLACQHRRHAVTKLLVVDNKLINKQDWRGNTALHYVCHLGDVRLAEILVNAGGNPGIKNLDGVTCIQEAEDRIYISLVNYLKSVRLE